MDAIQRFVSERTMAVIGVSASGKGFGNAAYAELKKRGFRLLPVHPTAGTIQGDACSARLSDLPEKVDRVLVVVKPDRAEEVVREAAVAGVEYVWLQQGAESPAALSLAASFGLTVVSGQCILMFTEPVRSFHRLHRWIWRLLGKLPS
jgi:uncharacterized protein